MKLRLKLRTSVALCALSLLVWMMVAHETYNTPTGQHGREAVLKTDLRVLRDAIDNYTLDRQQAPHSLRDLADAGYLRGIPVDPITLKPDWVPDFAEPVLGDPIWSPDLRAKELVDIQGPINSVATAQSAAMGSALVAP